MSDTLDSIHAPTHITVKRTGGKKGVAPRIRKLKLNHPELTDSEIARAVGCRPSNVSAVLKTFLGKNSKQDLQDYQENQADIFESLAHRLLSSLTQDKIDKTKPMEAITGAAILIDKARLVRGQATGINVTVLMDVVDALRQRPNPQPQQPISTTLAGNPPASGDSNG